MKIPCCHYSHYCLC